MRLHVAYVGSGYYPLSWNPLSILDSEQNILLEDSKDPPKTAGAVSIPLYSARPSPPGGLLDASKRLKTPLRRFQDGPQMPQEASKTPSDASKTPQEGLQRLPKASKIDFSSQHGPPKPQKTFKIYWKNNSSEPSHQFGVRSMTD